mgnify:CR=1 FL=1
MNDTIQNENIKGRSFGKGLAIGILSVLVATAIVTGLFILLGMVGLPSRTNAEAALDESQQLVTEEVSAKLNELNDIISEYFYHDVRPETLRDGLYRGLVESLGDPYAVYYTPEEFEALEKDARGEYSGVGIATDWDSATSEVVITEVYPDSPAERAGIHTGDRILSADGHLAADYDMEGLGEFIRGEKGSQVELVILRDGRQLYFTVTRDNITLRSVIHEMPEDCIGYLRISQFNLTTHDEFVEAITEMRSQGMDGLIVDLRGNHGGLVDAAVAVLDDILPAGLLVSTADKRDAGEVYVSDAEHYLDIPIVVLVDEDTASAAEIFAAAIRDFHYGTLVGTMTYGKGIIQYTLPLEDGSAICLTTETYYPPSGESFQGVGIAPDVELAYEFLGDEADGYDLSLDNQYLKGLEILRERR